MSRGFGIVIAVVVLANIAGALWLIWWTSRGSGKVAPLQTTHVWDGDLTRIQQSFAALVAVAVLAVDFLRAVLSGHLPRAR